MYAYVCIHVYMYIYSLLQVHGLGVRLVRDGAMDKEKTPGLTRTPVPCLPVEDSKKGGAVRVGACSLGVESCVYIYIHVYIYIYIYI